MFGGVNRQRRILCGITSHGVERCYTEDNIGRGHNVPLPALWGNVARISAELGMRAPLTGRDATGGVNRRRYAAALPFPCQGRPLGQMTNRAARRRLSYGAHLAHQPRRGSSAGNFSILKKVQETITWRKPLRDCFIYERDVNF